VQGGDHVSFAGLGGVDIAHAWIFFFVEDGLVVAVLDGFFGVLVVAVDVAVDRAEFVVDGADGVSDLRPLDNFATVHLLLHVEVQFVEEANHGH
jgi:hypothetical protein